MKTVQIDSLKLSDVMLKELSGWYVDENESKPEVYIQYLDQTKDTLIHLMCNDNTEFDAMIKESLSGIIQIQDTLKKLIPDY